MSPAPHFLDLYTQNEVSQVLLDVLSPFDFEWIYFFGSAAQKEDHFQSDLDFAFYSHTLYDSVDLFLKAQILAQRFQKEVDLIQLKTASTVFQKEVIHTSVLLYEKESSQRELYESIVLKKYARLNEERALLLEQYGVRLDD